MTEPYTRAMAEVVRRYTPDILLCGATALGRDLAPRLSARLHTGLTADCTGLEIDPETRNLMMTRPAFGGNIMATIACPDHLPQMATVRPGVMRRADPAEGARPPVEIVRVEGLAESRNVDILEIVKTISSKKDIQDARVLVAGGRAWAARKTSPSSRSWRTSSEAPWPPPGRRGRSWIGKDRQVGQTGKTVRPTSTSPAAFPAPSSTSPDGGIGDHRGHQHRPIRPHLRGRRLRRGGRRAEDSPQLTESIRNARAKRRKSERGHLSRSIQRNPPEDLPSSVTAEDPRGFLYSFSYGL
jgi:hypothetical protein